MQTRIIGTYTSKAGNKMGVGILIPDFDQFVCGAKTRLVRWMDPAGEARVGEPIDLSQFRLGKTEPMKAKEGETSTFTESTWLDRIKPVAK